MPQIPIDLNVAAVRHGEREIKSGCGKNASHGCWLADRYFPRGGGGQNAVQYSTVDLRNMASPYQEMGSLGRASKTATALSLINNLIGTDILGLPWAFKETSLGLGLVTILVISVVNSYTMILLARCCDISEGYSYMVGF